MRIEPTTDIDLVRAIVTHPSVYPWVIDDEGPPRDEYMPPPAEGNTVIYLLARDSRGGRGVFAFFRQNVATTEAHTCVLPSMWGRTHLAARAALAWVFENTTFLRIVTSVPDDNPLAARLATRAGMTHYGHNPQSFQRRGRLLGVDLFGISKEAYACQSQQQS